MDYRETFTPIAKRNIFLLYSPLPLIRVGPSQLPLVVGNIAWELYSREKWSKGKGIFFPVGVLLTKKFVGKLNFLPFCKIYFARNSGVFFCWKVNVVGPTSFLVAKHWKGYMKVGFPHSFCAAERGSRSLMRIFREAKSHVMYTSNLQYVSQIMWKQK